MAPHTLPTRAAILVADDEPFIALDITAAVEDAGGAIVGPAVSLKEALALLAARTVVGAILDVNLGDCDISPLADLLGERGIPFIFYTGVALPVALRTRFPTAVVIQKPEASELIIECLAEMIIAAQPSTLSPSKRVG